MKQILEDPTNFVHNLIQFKSFLKNAIGNEDPIDITKSYFFDTNAIIHILMSPNTSLPTRTEYKKSTASPYNQKLTLQ